MSVIKKFTIYATLAFAAFVIIFLSIDNKPQTTHIVKEIPYGAQNN